MRVVVVVAAIGGDLVSDEVLLSLPSFDDLRDDFHELPEWDCPLHSRRPLHHFRKVVEGKKITTRSPGGDAC